MSLSQSDYASYRRIGIVANEEYQHPTLLDFDMVTPIANDDGNGTTTPWIDLHTIPKDISDWDAVWNWHTILLGSKFLHQSIRIAKLYESLGLEDPEKVLNPNGPGSSGTSPSIPATTGSTYVFTEPDVNGKVAALTNGLTSIAAIGRLNSIIGTRSFTGNPTDGFTWKDNIGRDGNIITAGTTISHNLDQLDQAIGAVESYTGYVSSGVFWNGKDTYAPFKNLEALNRSIGSRVLTNPTHLLGSADELVLNPRAGYTDPKLTITDMLNRLVTTIGNRGVGDTFSNPFTSTTVYSNGTVSSSPNATPEYTIDDNFQTASVTSAIYSLSYAIGDRIIISNGDGFPLSNTTGSNVTTWVNNLNDSIGHRHFSTLFTATHAISQNNDSMTNYLTDINTAIGNRSFANLPASGFPLTSTNNGINITSALNTISNEIGNRQFGKSYLANSATVTASIISLCNYIDLMWTNPAGTPTSAGDVKFAGKVIASSGTTKGYTFDENPGGGTGDSASITYYVVSGDNTNLKIYNGNDVGDTISIEAGSILVQGGSASLTLAGNLVTASNLKSLGTFQSVGISTLGIVNAGATTTSSLNVTGNTSLNTLTTSGAASLGSLAVIGASTLNTLTTSGAANINSLTVTGSSSLNTLTTSGQASLGSIFCTGVTNLATLNAGTTTVGNLTSSGNIAANTMTATSSIFVGGTLTAAIGNITTVNSTNVNSTNLTTTGTTNLNNLTTTGPANIPSLTTSEIVLTGPIKDSSGNIIINTPGPGTPAIDLTALEARVTAVEGAVGSPSVSWAAITGKPTTFTPATHTQDWTTITGKPATFTATAHTHLWADITDKPATFTPATHDHDSAYLTKTANATTTFTITASGFNTSSDARLKVDVAPLLKGLDEVLELDTVRYRYHTDARNVVRYGLIAQDVMKLCPSAVLRGADDMLSIDYNQLVAVLINAVQELASRVK